VPQRLKRALNVRGRYSVLERGFELGEIHADRIAR
jgi:hypothetical protein